MTGKLKNEVDAFMSANGIPAYSWIKHLVVSGGEINSNDTSQTFFYGLDILGPSIKTIDFSATDFANNTVPGYAFQSCSNLSQVLLPDSITSIGALAFYFCSMLQDITLPDSLSSIGNSAFRGCSAFETMVIPAGVTTIGTYAFQNCTALKDIYMSSVNPPTASNNSFMGIAPDAAVHVPSGSEENYCQQYPRNKKWHGLIVEDPTDPAPEAWANTTKRTSHTTAAAAILGDEPCIVYYEIVEDGADEPVIEIEGNGVSSEEKWLSFNNKEYYTCYAMLNISGLEEGPKDIYVKLKDLRGHISESYKIDLEAYVAPIDVTIDSHQTGELNEEIQAYMEALGMAVNYERIKSLTVKGGMLNGIDWGVIDANRIKLGEALESIDLSGVTLEKNIVPEYSLYGLVKLGDVKLPDNVTTIGEGAFCYCTNLQSITLPEEINSIGGYAFEGCTNLASVTILSSAPPAVGEDAFRGIAADAAVYVPESSRAAYTAVDDGNTSDNLWYGLTITEGADESYTVSVFANPTEGGWVSGRGTYSEGEPVTVTAYVYGGYSFDSWTEDGSVACINNPYTFTMEASDRTLTANFSPAASDIITGSITGTVRDSERRPVSGAEVSLTVSGYVYAADTLTDGTYSILNVPEGINYTVTASKTGYNSGSVTVSVTAGKTTSGVDITIKAAANNNNSDKDNDSGGGRSRNTPATPTPPETLKTETVVSGNTLTVTMTTAAAVDNSGKATATLTQSQVSEAVGKAAEEASKKGNETAAVVEIKVEAAAAAKSVEASLPREAVDLIAGSNTAALTISTSIAVITFDAEAVDTISGQAAADVKISAGKVDTETLSEETKQLVGDRPVYDFSVTSGDKTISQFGGNVTVSVPYTPKTGEDINSIVIYYINAEGKPEIVSNCAYDPATGTISFTTNHFSKYAVGYNKVSFKDVPANAAYSKAVSFIAARGITTGMGDGKFSPESTITRGQFIVMVMRAYEIKPDKTSKDNFSDAGNTYYTNYLSAAKRLGLTNGTGNNKYSPDKEITQQEMISLLYKTLKVMGELPTAEKGKALTAYTDANQIESWAKDAMTLFVKAGIIKGTDNKLQPAEKANRAEMAQVLYNLFILT